MRFESIQNKANKIYGYSDRESQRTDRLNVEAETLLMDIRDIDGVVQETIINLRNYGNNDDHIKLPTALREAKMYLDDITNKSNHLQASERSLECANEHYETWNELLESVQNSRQKLDRVLASQKSFNDKLDDLKNLTHRTFRDASETEVFLSKNSEGFDRLERKANQLDDDLTELDELLDFNLIASAESTMESIHDGIARIAVGKKDMQDLTIVVEQQIENINYDMHDLTGNVIPSAQIHAQQLAERSRRIVDAYENSKSSANNAILAVTAHKNITDAVNYAEDAARKAHEKALAADMKLNPEGEDTITDIGNEMSLESQDIQEDAKQQMSKIEGKL